jgi:hypothetical protein
VYRAAAARPAPSFVSALGLALACGALSLIINLAHGAASTPDFMSRFSPALLAAVATAAIGLFASFLLLIAVMLYGLGNALGGKGDFDRGLQAAAMISVLWPVQMMCNWFPIAWAIPSALAAWIAACALEGLFGAKPSPTRALFAVFAAAAIGVQTLGHMLLDRARQTYGTVTAVTQAADSSADLARQMQALQQRAQAAEADGAAAMDAAAPAAAPGATPVSSLDLLRSGSDGGDAGSPQPQAPASPTAVVAAAKGMEANAVGMLDAMTPMLSNPAITRNMTPEQKANLKELQGMMADLKAQASSGKRLSDPDFALRMSRYQQLMLKVMAAAAAAPPPAAPAAAPATPQVHLKLPGDGAGDSK